MLVENEPIVKEIQKVYPNLPPYFIDLAVSYCQNRSEEGLLQLLNEAKSEDKIKRTCESQK